MSLQIKDALTQYSYGIAEVYIFISGNETSKYTSYSENITIGSEIIPSAPISRGELNEDLVQGLTRCSIQAPVTQLFAEYVLGAPFKPMSIEIRRYYLDDLSEYELRFVGIVNSISINKHIATAECLSSMNELTREVPKVYIQSICNNALYDSTCGINFNTAAYHVSTGSTLIVDSNGVNLTSTEFATKPSGFFSNGILVYDNEERFISYHSGSTVVLHFPFRSLTSGTNVRAYAGCDKTAKTCRNKFLNLVNFVGMPYVPLDGNPIKWGLD